MSEGEQKVIEILTDYKNQILDRKPFTHSFVDMQWAINSILDLYNKEKEKNKALKEGLKYRVNYCKLLEKELYANGVNYEFEKTEIEKQFLEE